MENLLRHKYEHTKYLTLGLFYRLDLENVLVYFSIFSKLYSKTLPSAIFKGSLYFNTLRTSLKKIEF